MTGCRTWIANGSGHDRDRANWLAAQGWTMRHFTDRDLYHRPDHIVDTVRAALRRAGQTPAIL